MIKKQYISFKIYINPLLFANLENDLNNTKVYHINNALESFLKNPDFSAFKVIDVNQKRIAYSFKSSIQLKKSLDAFFPSYSKIINKALEMYFYPKLYPDSFLD